MSRPDRVTLLGRHTAPTERAPDYLSFAGRRAPHPSPVKLSRKFFRAETSVLEINIDERRSRP